MASLGRIQKALFRPIVIFLAVVIAFLLGGSSAGERIEQSFSDWRLRHVSAPVSASPITVIAIDEAALDLLGPWPWPRSVMANLLDRLFSRYTPAAVGLDMVFPPGVSDSEDAALAKAMSGRPVVIGQLFTDENSEKGTPRYQRFADAVGLPQYRGVLANSALLAMQDVGHINALIDADGKMRRVWPAVCASGGCSAALSVRLFGLLAGIGSWHLEPGSSWQSAWRLVPEGASELALPLDEHYAAQVPWRNPPPHRYISAAQIWRGDISPESLQNQVILIGATAHGLGDRVNTPVGSYIPGVETHARVLGAWLDGKVPFTPVHTHVLLGIVWFVQMIVLLLSRQSGRVLMACSLLLSISILGVNLWLFRRYDLLLPLAEPTLFPLILGLGLTLAALYTDRRWIMSQIGAYLPAPLVRHLREHTPDPEEEMSWTTVMYADVIGSTVASRQMDAINVAHWGNRAVDLVAQEITERSGIIDNIAGDGLMVYWREGSPSEQAQRALASALAIRDGLARLNAEQQADWPPLRMGLGMHAGPLLAGSFGQARRRYTILGEVANLAFRIERKTRTLPAMQLISEALADQVPEMALQFIADVALDGSDEPIKLFTFADDLQNTGQLSGA